MRKDKMAKLQYPNLIKQDKDYIALADISTRLPQEKVGLILTTAVDALPVETLDLLAAKWSLTGFDGWAMATTEALKRELLKKAIFLHRNKGTPESIKNIIRYLGFGEVEIIERLSDAKRNGAIRRDNRFYHGSSKKWNHYFIKFKQPLSINQADLIRETVSYFAPARCILEHLDFKEVAFLHNNKLKRRDGSFTRGTVN